MSMAQQARAGRGRGVQCAVRGVVGSFGWAGNTLPGAGVAGTAAPHMSYLKLLSALPPATSLPSPIHIQRGALLAQT